MEIKNILLALLHVVLFITYMIVNFFIFGPILVYLSLSFSGCSFDYCQEQFHERRVLAEKAFPYIILFWFILSVLLYGLFLYKIIKGRKQAVTNHISEKS